MTRYSIDIRYAWARLGLAEGAPPEHIREVVANAKAYRFFTRERVEQVERFAVFFVERGRLGTTDDTFEAIRKAYYKQAMALHPDRTQGNANAEEQLKILNGAYEAVEDVHTEARDHFRKSESIRRDIETQAREETEREAEAAGKNPASGTVHMSYAEAAETETRSRAKPASQPRPPGAIKYMAAWVPRYIRNRRLFYLGRDAVIGSRLVKSDGSVGLLYDLLMLPEREFIRARLNLGIEGSGSPALEMSNLTPAYIPVDTREILVPPTETNPHEYAKTHFQHEYGL